MCLSGLHFGVDFGVGVRMASTTLSSGYPGGPGPLRGRSPWLLAGRCVLFSESAGNWRAEPPADEPSVGGTPLKRPRSGASGAQWRGSAGVPAGSDEAGRTHGRPSNSSPADTSLSSGVIAALIASYAVWRGCPINRFSVAGSGSENSLNFSGCWFALIPDNGRKTPSYRDDITSPTQAV